MILEGASIIDIGGASTRPGAKDISREQEWERIYPSLTSIRKEFPQICISIDTYHADVAHKSLEEGADMINDISGGTFDAQMSSLIGKRDIPFVIMHIQGVPGNMQVDPRYDDVLDEVITFLGKQAGIFREAGATRLILDPGFGFGKTVEHNYILLNGLQEIVKLGFPVLAGVSRKSMINKVLGSKPEDALNGTTALNTIALMNGAKILRVHDVKEAVEVVKLVGALKSEI